MAPDYILCDAAVKDRLVSELKKQITLQLGKDPLENENYGKIINEKHYHRLLGLMDEKKVIFGGSSREEELRIAPHSDG